MKALIVCIGLFFGVFNVQYVFSQYSCNQRFEQALKAYYTGQLRDVEPILAGCIGTLPKIQQEQALRLIIISNLYLRNLETADSAMLQLLKLNPIYTELASDQPEFISLLNSYNRNPLFSVGLSAGLNLGSYELIQSYSMSEIYTEADYNGKIGYQIGISGIYHISPQFWLNLDLIMERRNFESQETFIEDQEIYADEQQLRLEIPFTAWYVYSKWKYKPFVEAGVAINFLQSAQCTLTRTNTSLDIITPTLEFDFMEYREKINYQILVGIGVLKNINRGLLGFQFRYSMELKNQTENSPHYDNPDLILNYGFITNEFKTNVFSFSIFYLRSFYKPKKK